MMLGSIVTSDYILSWPLFWELGGIPLWVLVWPHLCIHPWEHGGILFWEHFRIFPLGHVRTWIWAYKTHDAHMRRTPDGRLPCIQYYIFSHAWFHIFLHIQCGILSGIQLHT